MWLTYTYRTTALGGLEATVPDVKRNGGIVGEVHNRTIHRALIDVLKGRWPASR
jgi:hypothetical protein